MPVNPSLAGGCDRLDPSVFIPDLLGLGRDLQILEPLVARHVFRVHLEFAAVFHDGRHEFLDVLGQCFGGREGCCLDGDVHGLLAVLLGLGQGIQGLGRVAETDAVFGGDEIPEELSLATHFAGIDHELVVIGRLFAFELVRHADGFMRLDRDVLGDHELLPDFVLGVDDALFEVVRRLVRVALAAGLHVRVFEGRGPVMVGHLLLAVEAGVAHVAVGTADPGRAMHAVVPGLVFGMLGLEHGRLGYRVHPIHEVAFESGSRGIAVGLVVGVDLLGILALAPGEDGLLGRAETLVLEIVFHVALAAHECALFVARQGLEILALGFQVILQRHGIEAQFHVGRIMAGGAADGVLVHIDFFAEFVEVFGPEIVAVFADPFVHLGALAVPAGGGQIRFFSIAVQAVDVQDVLHGVSVAARRLVFVAEGVAEPEILEIRLGVLVAFRQGIDVVVLVVGYGPTVLGHDLGFVVSEECFVVQGEFSLKGGVFYFVRF